MEMANDLNKDYGFGLGLPAFDIKELQNPSPYFKIFQPTQEKYKKLMHELMMRPFFLPDELRNQVSIQGVVKHFMNPYIPSIFYEVGEFDGLVGFTNIMPHYKAEFAWKIWNYDKIFTKTFVRETKKVIDLIIDSFKLKRLEFLSGDERTVKMGKIAGFTVEGIKKNDFLHRGKFYDSYILAKYGGV
jgi:predicted metallopeptidase